MEASAAATTFRALVCCLVVIRYFMNDVECWNYEKNLIADNCPHQCTCDKDSQTVNCTKAGFTKVPSDIPPDTLSLILDENSLGKLEDDSFSKLRNLQNL